VLRDRDCFVDAGEGARSVFAVATDFRIEVHRQMVDGTS
jgi:hypothetical protein